MPSTIITDIGVSKIRTASGSASSSLAITHIALGDGLGANYAPSTNQTALRRERARAAIESRTQIGNDSWRVKASFPTNTISFDVREMGFFDADGALIFLFAGLDIDPRKTGVIEYLIDHVLTFSRIADGLVIVDAPNDQIFDHALIALRTHAIIALEQFNQRLEINTLSA